MPCVLDELFPKTMKDILTSSQQRAITQFTCLHKRQPRGVCLSDCLSVCPPVCLFCEDELEEKKIIISSHRLMIPLDAWNYW